MIALKDVMDTLAARLKAASYKNVYAYPTSPVQTPGVVIGYPTNIEFDVTYGDGAEAYTIPIYFLVGRELTEQARDSLSDIIAGGSSIKRTIETNPMTGTDNQVTDCRIETIAVGGIEYLSATFTLDVIAQNA
jgi:hypothetical protein